MVGHHDREGLRDDDASKSWNSSHPTRGCGQEALKTGNFTAYDQAQKRLDAAIKRAAALAPQLDPDAAPATPSPSPSPTG